ncbi:MAG: PepSY-like domain-containing protein [Alistipes sp.]|nr:PepSY-like domain-containing protein [Alistipes sp.]
MKRLFTLGVALLSTLALMAASQHTVSFDKLPAKSRDFVHRYFAGDKVQSIDHAKHHSVNTYDVNFANGDKLSFDAHSGDCLAIHLAEGSIPSKLLPQGVQEYLKKHYPAAHATSIERINGGSCIGLSSGEKVCLNRDGKLIKDRK